MANYKDIKYQFPTSAVTSGTFADGRISESSVTQHAATVDLQPIKSDVTALALREATNETSAAFNLPNQFIETFTDDTNLGTQTTGDRTSGYWATVYTDIPTADAGGTKTDFTDSNTWWSSSGSSDDYYGTGNDIGYKGTGNNYSLVSSIDGTDANHAVASNDRLCTGDFRTGFTGVGHNSGTTYTTGQTGATQTEYYSFTIATGSNLVGQNASPLKYAASNNLNGISIAFGGNNQNVDIIQSASDGSTVTKTLLTTLTDQFTNSTEVSWVRSGSTLYLQYDGVTKYTVASGSFNNSDPCYTLWGIGRGAATSSDERTYIDSFYYSGASALKGIGTATASATGTLVQSANVVASNKTKVGGTLLYKDNEGTATLGTGSYDLKVEFTCNGGTNWTEAASYNAITPVYSSGIKMVRLGETTCTEGNDIRYRAVFANQASGSKETQLHGIGINY